MKVYGAVPPEGVRSIEPLFPPKHNTFVCVVLDESVAAGSVIVIVFVVEQLFASVIVTV